MNDLDKAYALFERAQTAHSIFSSIRNIFLGAAFGGVFFCTIRGIPLVPFNFVFFGIGIVGLIASFWTRALAAKRLKEYRQREGKQLDR